MFEVSEHDDRAQQSDTDNDQVNDLCRGLGVKGQDSGDSVNTFLHSQ